tara:strand:- start:1393 stop:2592 length:1200 start_codon:yes stop_codon:yes gene_type:complete
MTEENIDLEKLVLLTKEIGYPKNISEVLSPQQIDSFHDLLLKKDASNVYKLAKKMGNNALLEQAKDCMLDYANDLFNPTSFQSVYEFADSQSDQDLKEKVSEMVLEKYPLKAFGISKKYDDDDMRIKAIDLIIEDNIDYASEIAWSSGDRDFLLKVGYAIVNDNPEKAFNLGKKAVEMNYTWVATGSYKAEKEEFKAWLDEGMDLMKESCIALLEKDPLRAFYNAKSAGFNLQAQKAGYRLLEQEDFVHAYKAGIFLKEEYLTSTAKQKLYEKDDPEDLWNAAWDNRNQEDKKGFLRQAGVRLLSPDPRKALQAGKILENGDFIREAGYALIEIDPEESYHAGYRGEDPILLDEARDALVKKDPLKALKMAGRDDALKQKAIKALSGSTDDDLVAKLYE